MHRVLPAFRPIAFRLMILFGAHRRRQAIKCDVEGAELEVFRGAKNLLQAHHPWILCELHSRANDQACRELIGGFGYSFESVDENHVLALPHKEI